jgi:uncharacterized protein
MKLQLASSEGNFITGSGPGWVRIGLQEYRENVVLMPDVIRTGWAPHGADALTEADYEGLLDYAPDLVVLGTGPTIRFPHPRLTQALLAARVGVEVMDTAAACRTFNVLTSEGRKVLAALIVV